MVKNFNTKEEANAFIPSVEESTLMHVEETNECSVNGVNVVTDNPEVGDELYLDEAKRKVFVVGGTLNRSLISPAWEQVGHVFLRQGRRIGVINKTGTDEQYASLLQYSITAITSVDITVNLKIQDTSKSGDAQYATLIPVAVSLPSAAINEASAAAISAAVAAKAVEMGDTAAWWAYLADANDNKVTDESGTGVKIIIQCDVWKHWNQYGCSMSGGSIAFTTWGDMGASSTYFKTNGTASGYRGIQNFARGQAYWSTNGRVPTSNVVLPEAGDTNPLKLDSFLNSEYCEAVRAKYATYMDYLKGEFSIEIPQHYGTFALPTDLEATQKYGPMLAPTKDGGTKAKFTAMNKCYNVSYNCEGLRKGDWFLPGSELGCKIVADENLSILARTISKAGGTAINNSTERWWSEGYSVHHARIFHGCNGYLDRDGVYYRYRVQAVVLLEY